MTANELEIAERGEDTQQGKYLTFELEDAVFGIEIRNVTEIIGMQPITPLPEAPKHVKGIVNLRGSVIPVIDVRLKFGMKPKEYDDRTCIIVIDIIGIKAGLIVDRVAEVIKIEDGDITPPLIAKAGIKERYLLGIGSTGDEVKLLLSCEELFGEEELN